MPIIGTSAFSLNRFDWGSLAPIARDPLNSIPLVWGRAEEIARKVIEKKAEARIPVHMRVSAPPKTAEKLRTAAHTPTSGPNLPTYTSTTTPLLKPHWHKLELVCKGADIPTQRRLPAMHWRNAVKVKCHFAAPPALPKAPRPTPPSQMVRYKPGSRWAQVHSLCAKPQWRNTVLRMMHGRVPQRNNGSQQCSCGKQENADHIIGACPRTQALREKFITDWKSLLPRILPMCWDEASAQSDTSRLETPKSSACNRTH